MYDDDDDDESNDSDYGSKDAQSRGGDGAVEEVEEQKKVMPMTAKRQRLAEEAWKEMAMKEEEATKAKMARAIIFDPYHFSIEKSISNKSNSKTTKPSSKQSYGQIQAMLSSVFGNKSTEIQTSGSAKVVKESLKCDDQSMAIREEIRRAVAGLHHKQIVTESVKFAGKEIKVKVTKDVVGSGSGSSNNNNSKPAQKRGLDDVLDTIKGPRVVSTVDKSAMDWTNFKEQEGLEDTLAVAAKEGFLTRQEFLNRCDVRAFERERDDRLSKQAAASSSTPAGAPAL